METIIDDIGSRGDRVPIILGRFIFIPSCKMGERVKVRIRNGNEKFALAERVV